MIIREIFDRPINREINPAVVVSNAKRETVEAEIKEDIFTDELIEKLYTMLDTVLNKSKGKTGIWVNGYYGSGKSHFIKYVHYCLDPVTSAEAFEHYLKAVKQYDTTRPGKNEDITESNVTLMRRRMERAHCDNILFNVEDETDDHSGERLTRIILNMFNRFRGYNDTDIPLALLFEKYLHEKGKFEEFKRLVGEELSHDWEADASQIASFELEGILEIAKRLVPEMDIVALHHRLSNPETYHIGIKSSLIPELKDFLKGKDKDYRLIFLVDEVSQYIGTNKELLLNLQNIVERVSEDCENRVWIACTAQQTLEDVASNLEDTGNLNDEFGKILGRFDTRISLESNDASYITQKRVLDKNAVGLKVLGELYDKKEDAIQNQFKMRHDQFRGFEQDEEFFLAYPFVPYQFKLIAHVFESFQALGYVIKEVKDNERSVLGITHFTAKQNADKEVGYIIPFDAFYNQQFSTNLTHRGRKAIENGLTLQYVQAQPFAERVVKALFMISNLSQPIQVGFPPTVDNLTVLLMTDLDQNKFQLQKNIKEVLDQLLEGNVIREEKGSFFFFNEDEMDVQMLIRNQKVIFEEKLENFDEIFRRMAAVQSKCTFGSNDFKIGFAVEDKEFLRNGDVKVTVLLTDNQELSQRAMYNRASDLCLCVNEWFQADDQLRKDFDLYCRTLKYLKHNSDSASGVRSKTNRKFSERNNDLKRKITTAIENKFPQTRFISGQQVLEASEVNGTQPQERFKNLLAKHLERLYKHHKLAKNYAKTAQELRTNAAAALQTSLAGLTPAEQMVDDYITNHGNELSVADLLKNFEKAPFGWRDTALMDILAQLVKKKKREFEYHNKPRYPVLDFINKALTTTERPNCIVKAGEEIDQITIDEAIQQFREVFNQDLKGTSDGNELFDQIRSRLTQLHGDYKNCEEDYFSYPFGVVFHQFRQKLQEWQAKRDPIKLFKALASGQIAGADGQKSVKELFDAAKGLRDFVNQSRQKYDEISKFYQANRENFRSLSDDGQNKVDLLADLLISEDPRKEFRHAAKAYDELKTELRQALETLRERVKEQYRQVFRNLQAEAEKLEVREANVYADETKFLEGLDRIKTITELELKQSRIADFQGEQVGIIVKRAAKRTFSKIDPDGPVVVAPPGPIVGEPVEYYASKATVTITNEQELEQYLKKIKEEMMALLNSNKSIIIK
ncbi:BREX system P-loop protein BrxC [soil metagenome]